MRKAFELLQHVVFRVVEVPAVHKWTEVEPVVAKLLVMVSCFKLLRRVLQDKLGLQHGDGDSDLSDDAMVGAPKDEMCTHRKLATKRNTKTLLFFEAEDTQWRLLVWLLVCAL